MLGDEDDDLIVDIEEVEEGVPEPDDDLVSDDALPPRAVSPSLPGDDEDDEEAEPIAARSVQDDVDDEYDDSSSRISAAETEARQARAEAIVTEGRAMASLAHQQIQTADVAIGQVANNLEQAYSALAHARSVGDYNGESDAQRMIDELRSLRTQLEARKGEIPNPDAILQQAQNQANSLLSQQPRGKQVGAGIQARHKLAERWAAENGWMKSNRSANQFVIAQSETMVRDGWDPNSRSFYAELAKRVKRAHPSLAVKTFQAKQKGPQARGGARTPAAPAASATGTPRTRQMAKNRYTLTADDQRAMKRFNLDPSNPEHRKYFAKSRIESARAERVRG